MSYEAWGDGDDGQDTDHLIEAGWWPSEQADEVKRHIEALRREQVYEGGMMQKGVNTLFLARISLLSYAAGGAGRTRRAARRARVRPRNEEPEGRTTMVGATGIEPVTPTVSRKRA